MELTREELEVMPITLLRGRDIKNAEEEKLVQDVLNSRVAEMPVDFQINIPNSRTDPNNMTYEDEMKLQAEIDAKRAAHREKLLNNGAPRIEEEAVPVEVTPEVVPESSVKVLVTD